VNSAKEIAGGAHGASLQQLGVSSPWDGPTSVSFENLVISAAYTNH